MHIVFTRLFLGILCLIFGLHLAHASEVAPKTKETSENRWDKYFKRKLFDPPAGFVVEALKVIPRSNQRKIALDLGSGVGHETLLLLKHGYQVIAIDKNETAFKYMFQQPAIQPFQQHVKKIVSPFEKVPFAELPSVDLVVASFSLPFVAKKDFNKVWKDVAQQIKPGGYFIGNVFDEGFSFFDQKFRPHMTFHTKEEARNLFQDFDILYFKEVRADSLKKGTQNHYYVIIAKKRGMQNYTGMPLPKKG